jgi:RNA polymerase sigma-70 factor (ECF subfamily)
MPDLDGHEDRTKDEERDDASLLSRVQSGDQDALAALYDRHGSIAFGLACRITGDESGAEEAVQDAFVSLWKQAPRFDPSRGQVRSWLLTIVHHRAVDLVRRRSSRPERQLPDGVEEFLVDSRAGPEQLAEWALNARAVRDAVSRIPDDQRKTVEMAYFAGMTHSEIAEAMDVPLGTVKSRLRIAFEKMREDLRPKVRE